VIKAKIVVSSEGTGSDSTQGRTNSPRRILVVDDDSDICRLNAEVLMRCGYEVDAAEDGEAGWNLFQAVSYTPDSYDLLITDNNMPKVSGVDLLKKLHAARMVLPVIMIAGSLPTEEFTRSPWLQPAATLLKPYTFEELLAAVKEVLREADSAAGDSQRFVM
jgi:DNA-binding response OmpR family regulator